MNTQPIKTIGKKLPKYTLLLPVRSISTSKIYFNSNDSIFEPYKKYQTTFNNNEEVKKDEKNAASLLPPEAFPIASVLFKQQGLSSHSARDFHEILNLATRLIVPEASSLSDSDREGIEDQILDLCGDHPETLYKYGNVALHLVRLSGNEFGSVIALKMYEISFKKGYQNAQYTYANLLHEGFKGIQKNSAEADTMMQGLADSGNPLAQTKFATWRIEAGDFPTAIQYLEQAADSGWGQASVQLGHLYRLGNGVDQDTDRAITYYQRAIDQKEIAQSHFYLGRCYAIHQTPNHEMSFKHYRIAAKQGLPEAQYNVGFCYASGLGTPKDFTLAAEYYQMASLQKFTLAMINLAKLYFEGGGEEDPKFAKDPWKGVHLLKEAAKAKGKLGEDAKTILDGIDLDSLPKQNDKDGKCSIM